MNIEEATGSVRDMQKKKEEDYVSSYISYKMEQLLKEETYMEQLLSQGQDNLNICPECFANNKQRKRCCKNMVVLVPDNVMVCCYLGDKNEITKAKFKKKVRELKRSQ